MEMLLQKRDEPYNKWAVNGSQWLNYSVDYSLTYKNLHFFGEAALDKRQSHAVTSGALISVDPKVDVSFLYRDIGKGYQSLYGNAFTENVYPTNEKGFYAGALQISVVLSIDLDDVNFFPNKIIITIQVYAKHIRYLQSSGIFP